MLNFARLEGAQAKSILFLAYFGRRRTCNWGSVKKCETMKLFSTNCGSRWWQPNGGGGTRYSGAGKSLGAEGALSIIGSKQGMGGLKQPSFKGAFSSSLRGHCNAESHAVLNHSGFHLPVSTPFSTSPSKKTQCGVWRGGQPFDPCHVGSQQRAAHVLSCVIKEWPIV